jgi:hypothetical protein
MKYLFRKITNEIQGKINIQKTFKKSENRRTHIRKAFWDAAKFFLDF